MDAVGMSTVPEFLSGASIGMKTLGFAMITNVIKNDKTEVTHVEVLENAKLAVPLLTKILLNIIKELPLLPEV